MRYLAIVFLLILTTPSFAGQSEARETARLNNCPPKKIEVYKNQLGREGETIYQVTCNLPKMADKDASMGPDALLIDCNGALCEMLRPLALDKK